MEVIYNKIFPIDMTKYDDTICRDKFIRNLLDELDEPAVYGPFEIPRRSDVTFRDNYVFKRDSIDSINTDASSLTLKTPSMVSAPSRDTTSLRSGSVKGSVSLFSDKSVSPKLRSSIFSLSEKRRQSTASLFSVYTFEQIQADFKLRRVVLQVRKNILRELRRKRMASIHMSKVSRIPLLPHFSWHSQLRLIRTPSVHFFEVCETIKHNALHFMFMKLLDELEVHMNSERLQHNADASKLQHNLFSWSLEHFIKRSELKDNIYIEVLQHGHSDEYLSTLKLQADVSELHRFCKFIYYEFDRGFTPSWHRSTMKVMIEANLLLNMEENLSGYLNTLINNEKIINSKVSNITWILFNTYKTRLSDELHEEDMKSALLSPIEYRYQKRHYKIIAEMNALKQSQRLDNIEKQIKHYKNLTKNAEKCSGAVQAMYYGLIDQYNTNLDVWQAKFANDLEAAEDNIIITKSNIDNAQEKLLRLQENLEFMRRRVAEVQEQIEKDRLKEIASQQASVHKWQDPVVAAAEAKAKQDKIKAHKRMLALQRRVKLRNAKKEKPLN